MKINFDTEKLRENLLDFYNITGISITIVTSDRRHITGYAGKCREFCKLIQKDHVNLCSTSDRDMLKKCKETKKPCVQICHAHLMDAAIPVIIKNEIAGYVILGQIRRSQNYDDVATYVPPALKEELRKHYMDLPYYTDEQIKSALKIACVIVTKIIEEEMITITSEELSQLATDYVEKNLGNDLSLNTLCRHLNVSKNRLYKCFRDYFDCTISEYINKKRIEKSIELLNKHKLSIDEIAKEVGFSDSSYFHKVFKKETGKTPRIYTAEQK